MCIEKLGLARRVDCVSKAFFFLRLSKCVVTTFICVYARSSHEFFRRNSSSIAVFSTTTLCIGRVNRYWRVGNDRKEGLNFLNVWQAYVRRCTLNFTLHLGVKKKTSAARNIDASEARLRSEYVWRDVIAIAIVSWENRLRQVQVCERNAKLMDGPRY